MKTEIAHFNEPYPNIGDVLTFLASVAGTKSSAFKGSSRYRKQEDFSSRKSHNPEIIKEAITHLFTEPLCRVISKEFSDYFSNCISLGLDSYLMLMKRIPMEGVSPEKLKDKLNEHLLVETLASMIWKVGTYQINENTVPAFYLSKNPIVEQIKFYEGLVSDSEQTLNDYFKDNVRSLNNWRTGREIPNLQNTMRLACWASQSDQGQQVDDKIAFYLARLLAKLNEISGYKYQETFAKAVAVRLKENREPVLDRGLTFSLFYHREIAGLQALSKQGLHIQDKLRRTSTKLPGDLDAFKRELDAFDEEVNKLQLTDQVGYFNEWLRARQLILSGNYEAALAKYMSASEHALYKNTDHLKKILKEGLAIAAMQQSSKSNMKKLKSRALIFSPEIIEPNFRGNDVTVDEIGSWQLSFVFLFPRCGWFEEGYELHNQKLAMHDLTDLSNKSG
ncbi:MAG: hypothetical protein ACI9SP_004366 [Arenicella sp.]|jgi:hypothetical protein